MLRGGSEQIGKRVALRETGVPMRLVTSYYLMPLSGVTGTSISLVTASPAASDLRILR